MKRKIFIFLASFGILLLTGCDELVNTPTRRVEELFGKYQVLDEDITNEIDNLLDQGTLTQEHQNRYRKVLEKQYRNLVYDVKDEEINGDTAIVTVEIEVLDYRNSILDLENTESINNNYLENYIQSLENTKEKVKYTLDISVSKIDNKWRVNPLSQIDIKKIQGMY